jgi:hypothetical protein
MRLELDGMGSGSGYSIYVCVRGPKTAIVRLADFSYYVTSHSTPLDLEKPGNT